MNKEEDFMSDYDNAIFRLATAQEAEPEDYTGSANAGKHWKPQTGSRSTGRKWNG